MPKKMPFSSQKSIMEMENNWQHAGEINLMISLKKHIAAMYNFEAQNCF